MSGVACAADLFDSVCFVDFLLVFLCAGVFVALLVCCAGDIVVLMFLFGVCVVPVFCWCLRAGDFVLVFLPAGAFVVLVSLFSWRGRGLVVVI